jgi:toxin FitB
MNGFLLDTNVISELRKTKPHGGVIAWLATLREEQISISAVTLGELQSGVELTRRQDPAKAAEIEAWIDRLIVAYHIIPMDLKCFREYARYMIGRPDQLIEDAMIAATAKLHGLIVATRNERDFRHFPVEVMNPFTSR